MIMMLFWKKTVAVTIWFSACRCMSLYASSLWDLYSNDAEKIYKSWNVTVRNVFSLDRKTHCRLIEPLSGCFHLKTALLSRYVKFYQTLR